VLDLGGAIPRDFRTWVGFYEIGPKTASLLLWSAFRLQTTVPVDSHVWHAFKQWKWTNAKSAEECSWQVQHWIQPTHFILTNDVIGSIRQVILRRRGWLKRKAKEHAPAQFEKICLL
jgi:endonuclease III